jgi:hypothetical protein
MRAVLAFGIAAIMMASPALGALPPGYQRAAELKAAIDAAADVLSQSGQTITGIRFLDTDRYEVLSEQCTVFVDIVDEPQATDAPMMVGPRQFKAVAQEPSCS